jgi:hypothetical protein
MHGIHSITCSLVKNEPFIPLEAATPTAALVQPARKEPRQLPRFCACTACTCVFNLRWSQTLLATPVNRFREKVASQTKSQTAHLGRTANIGSAGWRERTRPIQNMSCSATFAGRKDRICPTTHPSSGTTSTPCTSCKLWPCGPSNRRQTSQVRASWQAGEVRTSCFFLLLHLLHLHLHLHSHAAAFSMRHLAAFATSATGTATPSHSLLHAACACILKFVCRLNY